MPAFCGDGRGLGVAVSREKRFAPYIYKRTAVVLAASYVSARMGFAWRVVEMDDPVIACQRRPLKPPLQSLN